MIKKGLTYRHWLKQRRTIYRDLVTGGVTARDAAQETWRCAACWMDTVLEQMTELGGPANAPSHLIRAYGAAQRSLCTASRLVFELEREENMRASTAEDDVNPRQLTLSFVDGERQTG